MNLSYFRSFAEVVKRGSFSEAGKALGLSQPTISFQIQRLEGDLSVKLLERQGGRVIMTEAGKQFLAFVERVMSEQIALQERLSVLRTEVVGRLSLGASTNPGEYILPHILGEFRKRFPKVEAVISIADTAEIVDRVMDRQYDAGFVGAEVKRRGLVANKIKDDELVLIAPPGHPLTGKKSVSLSDVEKEDFVLREEGSGTQKTVEQLMVAAGLQPSHLKIALVAGSNQAVITAVEAGVGVAFASRMAASRSLQLGLVKVLPLKDLSWKRGIYFIRPSVPIETKLLQELSVFVEEWAAAQSGAKKAVVARG